jgi:cysteinyl-tRNA synthetase
MALKAMGERYDIHASGRELIFPHHENHMAISVAMTGHPMANYWIHCERVLFETSEKGKNKEGVSLKALFEKGYSGRVIRYWLLSSHYRKPLSFSEDRLEEAGRALKRIDACLHALQEVRGGKADPETDQLLYDIKHGFISAMDDDLNMPEALASLFDKIRKVNVGIRQNRIDADGAQKILNAFRDMDRVLNIFSSPDSAPRPEAAILIQEREAARKAGDWETADRLRERLRSMGIEVRDAPI